MNVTIATKSLNAIGFEITYNQLRVALLSKKIPIKTAIKFYDYFEKYSLDFFYKMSGAELTNFLKKHVGEDIACTTIATNKKRRIEKLKRILKKYGKDIFKDFKNVKNVPFHTLTDIGEKYGFSREYARQTYEFIYQSKYKEAIKQKAKLIEETQCVNNPKRKVADFKRGSSVHNGAIFEKLFMEECEAMGLDVNIPCDSVADIIVNGFVIDVKGSFKTQMTSVKGNVKYHKFRISKEQREICDFFACYHGTKETFFIIPNKEKGFKFKKQRMIYISKKKTNYYSSKNRYHKYENRFDLLKNEEAALYPSREVE